MVHGVKNNMSAVKEKQNKVFSITRDSGANVKILKSLERKRYIKVFDVMLENGRENKKVKEKVLPVGVWGHSLWGESVWAGTDNKYDEIREIIGKNNIEDAMHLEVHLRSNHDYFVTEDKDFLTKREILEQRFGVNIVTPEELEKICNS